MVNLTGLKFNMLRAIEKVGKDKYKNNIWLFKCDCGNETKVVATLVKNGHTKSCGCLQYESRNIKHGKCYTRIYKIYSSMMTRCYNKNSKSYSSYGNKGIKVCERWHNFENFYEDTKNGYSDNLTLDRYPNNQGDYEPNNFRWATKKEQGKNRKITKLYNYDGEVLCVPEIAERLEISEYVLYGKLGYGWTLDEAIHRIKTNK